MSLSRSEFEELLNAAIQPLKDTNNSLKAEIQNLRQGLDPNTGSPSTERQIKARVAQEEKDAAIARIKSRLQEENVSFQEDEFNTQPQEQKRNMKLSDLDEFDGTDVYSFELSVDTAMAQFSTTTVASMMARVLKGLAKTWFQNLDHRIRDGCLVDADEFMRALKSEFAIDKGLARQAARDRKWKIGHESVATYYYDKLKLVGNSYGNSMDAAEKCFEVRDGLPEDFKILVRTTLATRPTLESLRKELISLEADYMAFRQASKALIGSSIKSVAAQHNLVPAPRLPLGVPQVALPRVKQENVPGRRMTMRDSFNPQNIGVAPNPLNPSENVRTYTVPDGSGRMLYLTRPCRQCGGQHFDFEPNHGKPAQARLASSSDSVSDSEGYQSSYVSSSLPDRFVSQSYGYPSQYYTAEPIQQFDYSQSTAYGYPVSHTSPFRQMPYASQPMVQSHQMYPSQATYHTPRAHDSPYSSVSEFYSHAAAIEPIVIEDDESYYSASPKQRLIESHQDDNMSGSSTPFSKN